MKAEEMMTSHVVCCTPDESLACVAQLMRDNDCGMIPVVKDKKSMRLVGVITDRGITVRAVSEGRNPMKERVNGYMTADPTFARIDTDFMDCLHVIEKRQIRRLPIVDKGGCCVGVISQADIVLHDPDDALEVLMGVSQPSA